MFRVVINATARTALRSASAASARKSTMIATRSFGTTKQQQAKRISPFLIGGATIATSGFVIANSNQINASTVPDYDAVRQKIAKIIEDEQSHGPLLVRLAWHASGTYDKNSKTGGSNGATMRYKPESDDPANNGLGIARNLLEPIKKQFPGISYADLWTLAGVVAIEEMGGPKIKWNPGRVDEAPNTTKVPANGRLPDADKGAPTMTAAHVRQVFGRMGFNDREIVALLGAHALGRCHPDRSGYSGPWTRAETTFSNEFFRELIENKWTEKKWNGPKQFEDPTGQLMMLPADMVLIQDPEFKKYVQMYAKDEGIFFSDFSKAFQKLEELGFDAPKKSWLSWLSFGYLG